MVELQLPSQKMVPSYLDFIEETRNRGEKIWESLTPRSSESTTDFIDRLRRAETHPDPGLVPETTYWAIQQGRVVGRIALRHTLNESLREFGGHIGYEVRPSARRTGVATEMLKQILKTPKAQEIRRLLLTCAPDNVGSNRAILSNGGVLEKTVYVQKWNRDTNYYWIDVSITG